MRLHRFTLTLLAVCGWFALGSPSNALAQPANDNFGNATTVSSLPFSDSQDLSTATTDPGEPLFCGTQQTDWYSFTPSSDVVVNATTVGSSVFSTNISVFRQDGSGFGGLTFLGCGQFGNSIQFHAHAGTTYYIQGGNVFGGFGTLQLNLTAIPPPPNDNFADAIPISGVPFSDSPDLTGATTEAGEPLSCAPFIGTAWYAFTPTTSGSYSTGIFSGNGEIAVYTGSSLQNLTQVACGNQGGLSTWHADAGTTYYIQAGTLSGFGAQVTVQLEQTPPPQVGFFWGPGDPSIFDTISFFDQSFDPANIGIQTHGWNFGDGQTASGCCPTHQYAKDGDYTVKLTDTTVDGRSASATNVVHVRTHDIAITSFLAPNTAKAGKTSTFDVKLSDTRYPEQVEVDLMKSDPTSPFGGFFTVASLTQGVQVSRSATDFRLNYTFTSGDAALGKLTFKAVATIIGPRDAVPADNTAIALPTRVTP